MCGCDQPERGESPAVQAGTAPQRSSGPYQCASLAPQNRPKGPRLLAPRTTWDIRGEIVPGDGASLVSLFLDSLSLPTSPLATTMLHGVFSSVFLLSCPTPPILSLTMGEPRGGTWLVPCRPGGCRYGRPTHINSTALILHSPLPLAPAPIPSCNTPCTCSARREGQVYGSHGALEGALPGCHGALPVIDGAIP